MKALMIPALAVLALPLCAAEVTHAPPTQGIRVLVWDEQQPEQKRAYGGRFLGETIAAQLMTRPGLNVTSTSLSAPDQGLDEPTLAATDVLVYWSHQKNTQLADPQAERVVSRVKSGQLALIALHSAHWAKPFVRLMQERAKEDAMAQVPPAERAAVQWEYANENPIYKGVERNAPLTPSVTHQGNRWRLVLPQCVFPAYRPDGAPSHVTTLLPSHPIAAGLHARRRVKPQAVFVLLRAVARDAAIVQDRLDVARVVHRARHCRRQRGNLRGARGICRVIRMRPETGQQYREKKTLSHGNRPLHRCVRMVSQPR